MFTDGFLSALNVPKDEVEQLRKYLNGYAGDLEYFAPSEVQESSFGGSSLGSSVGHHAGLAQQALEQALVDMVSGLRGQAQGLRDFTQDVELRDEDSAATLTLLQRSVDCVETPTSALPSQCTLPTSGGDA